MHMQSPQIVKKNETEGLEVLCLELSYHPKIPSFTLVVNTA